MKVKGAGSIVSCRCKILEAESGDEQSYVNSEGRWGALKQSGKFPTPIILRLVQKTYPWLPKEGQGI